MASVNDYEGSRRVNEWRNLLHSTEALLLVLASLRKRAHFVNGIPCLKILMEKDCTKVVHSKRVENMKKYTPNEWRRWKYTLETSGEDEKIHSKRVEKMEKYTRNWCSLGDSWSGCHGQENHWPTDFNWNETSYGQDWWKNTLETSGEDEKIYTRKEWGRRENTSETSEKDIQDFLKI